MAVPTALPAPAGRPALLRRELGVVLRRTRQRQSRTLRDVAGDAGISVGYLSELERGRKEASSELLSTICRALGLGLSDLLVAVADEAARLERRTLTTVAPPAGTTRAAA